jgi:hypothetical protein
MASRINVALCPKSIVSWLPTYGRELAAHDPAGVDTMMMSSGASERAIEASAALMLDA